MKSDAMITPALVLFAPTQEVWSLSTRASMPRSMSAPFSADETLGTKWPLLLRADSIVFDKKTKGMRLADAGRGLRQEGNA